MEEKQIHIEGCILVPAAISKDEVIDKFLDWVESNGWLFGGGFQEIEE